jgi:hypothetical protein
MNNALLTFLFGLNLAWQIALTAYLYIQSGNEVEAKIAICQGVKGDYEDPLVNAWAKYGQQTFNGWKTANSNFTEPCSQITTTNEQGQSSP